MTSHTKSDSPFSGFEGEKAAKGSAGTEREPGRHGERERKKKRGRSVR